MEREGACTKMTFIIFDLEWVATFYKGQMPEIISIGAVKLQVVQGKLVEVGQFQQYVRPQKAKRLNKRTIKITGIRPMELMTKESFPQAWKRFIHWMGDDYYLLTWGSEDIRTIIRNCKQHRVTLDWLRNYNDLQAEFGRLYKLQNQLGLMNAMEMLQQEPVGQHHSAFDDARNTAEIFKACFRRLELQTNNFVQINRKFGPKPVRKASKPKPKPHVAPAVKNAFQTKSLNRRSTRKPQAQ
jgi:inhibitor of KinA sporulation pathway (predicted exonuclease)